ncbi:MarR family transcriptional regulator [Marinomonas sp. SBI22]|uniref:MarR family winged helix-turn-helix transcriptional regulator n=1 Tax=unclassified Marinomonas TaxID=196814 RepID=UPI0007AFA40C|nr:MULTISPECIES: MarR family transcriptional regulator [unclassified Marinomonas]KZM39233.1 MarR family transcriptional regulator [Marinomonas sp. SBI22]KZM40220.1 MarR family transcriptional regulator [Marinomonas sp. SBI8L]
MNDKDTNKGDAVDAIKRQWQTERPDLSLDAMGIFGRLKRCSMLMTDRLDNTFAKFDLNYWEFDVLATLRRSGAPYTLAPTELFSIMMITSGTMTHRMKRLEARGLIERLPNPDDARSQLVKLSQTGFDIINKTATAHVDNMENMLSDMSDTQKKELDSKLTKLLAIFEK